MPKRIPFLAILLLSSMGALAVAQSSLTIWNVEPARPGEATVLRAPGVDPALAWGYHVYFGEHEAIVLAVELDEMVVVVPPEVSGVVAVTVDLHGAVSSGFPFEPVSPASGKPELSVQPPAWPAQGERVVFTVHAPTAVGPRSLRVIALTPSTTGLGPEAKAAILVRTDGLRPNRARVEVYRKAEGPMTLALRDQDAPERVCLAERIEGFFAGRPGIASEGKPSTPSQPLSPDRDMGFTLWVGAGVWSPAASSRLKTLVAGRVRVGGEVSPRWTAFFDLGYGHTDTEVDRDGSGKSGLEDVGTGVWLVRGGAGYRLTDSDKFTARVFAEVGYMTLEHPKGDDGFLIDGGLEMELHASDRFRVWLSGDGGHSEAANQGAYVEGTAGVAIRF